MQKKFIASLNREVGRLGFGLMRLALTDPKDSTSIDQDILNRMVDNAMSRGMTYFDTAYVYHMEHSEGAAKKALVDRYPRESFTIADKIPTWLVETEEDCQRLFDIECERLGVDYIDFCLLHGLTGERLDTKVRKFHMNEWQLKMKAEGRIRYAGFSFHDTPEALREILAGGQWDFVQLQINFFDWDDYAKRCYDLACEFGVPVIVMEPIRGGHLINVSEDAAAPFRAANPDWNDASWALRFVADLDNVAVILSGMSTEEQMEDNLNIFDSIRPLLPKEKEAYSLVSKALHSKALVPCTGCRYCMDCPFGVDIPEIFRWYNAYKMFTKRNESVDQYQKLILEGHDATKCQKCGACVSQCPQAINTPELLEEIHRTMTSGE